MINETPLLIPEPPLQVLPTLAKAIGLNEAIVTQQLHYLMRDKGNGRIIDGHKWIYNTHEQWRDSYFSFWSVETVKSIFQTLESRGILVSCQPEGAVSRRKYYRISEAARANLTAERFLKPAKKERSRKGKVYPIEKANITPSSEEVKFTPSSLIDHKTSKKNSEDLENQSTFVEQEFRKLLEKMDKVDPETPEPQETYSERQARLIREARDKEFYPLDQNTDDE